MSKFRVDWRITLFTVINLFGAHTGLNVYHDKTESLLLTNHKETVSSLELDFCEFQLHFKILGVYFTHNTLMSYKLNFESIEISLKNLRMELERINADWKSANYCIVCFT